MGFFNSHSHLEKEISNLDELLKVIQRKLNDQELELAKMQSHIISLRGLVNRRLSGGKSEETEEKEETEESPEAKNSQGIKSMHYY